MKTKNLESMYKDLKRGNTVNCNGCTIFIDYDIKMKHKYIFYQKYGRSAKKLGINNLRLICRDIADSTDYSYDIID